ncbi:hypothetical protein MAR_029923 [Mya arenaria]|uniref:Uncharacterized protein n=1 Tax=Mya arenaria TaxID=6604 RepID=A0ABY7DJ57_MYAAR|nr:hypothetical protein MAR_029923 [Mya arenaria]
MSEITNQVLVDRLKDFGVSECSKWLHSVASNSDTYVSDVKTSYDTLSQRTFQKYKSLFKSRNNKGGTARLEVFLNTPVNFPKHKVNKPVKKKSENVVTLQGQVECLTRVAGKVVNELNESMEENKKLLKHIETVSPARIAKFSNVKMLKKTLKKYKDKQRYLKRNILSFQNRIRCKNDELKRIRAKNSYAEFCIKKLSDELEQSQLKYQTLQNDLDQNHHELNTHIIKCEELKTKLRDCEEENYYLRCLVNDSVQTYDEDGRKFTPELQQCVYELLNFNVSFSNVSPVIQSVLAFVKIKPNRLPSKATINNMSIQRLALSQRHIAEQLRHQENTCILSDETNKFGTKYEGIHATDENGNYWVLGVREISTKAGKDVLQTLQQILGDIDVVSELSENPASIQILKNISSTMSDRASTQIKFNQLLEDFRTDVLKEDLGDEWENMTNEEQLSISKLCNIFCSLHALVHMAETCSKSLITYELDIGPSIFDPSFKNDSEPGTVRLVRTTACKAFSKGGDEKNGQYLNFQTYCKESLQENGLRSVPLERFRGNRFNILFRNAANVFFLEHQIRTYLAIEHSNRLLASINHDINVPEYVAGCKSLGLISELITAPLWFIIEDENLHIIEAQTLYQELVKYLKEFPQHIRYFMEGNYVLSFVDQAKLTSSKVFLYFLPDGTLFEASDTIKEKTQSVPKHNKFSETIFGHMDRLLREKPNTTQIASEANMMFVHNKTVEWLRKKTDNEKESLVKNARKDVNHLRQSFKLRHLRIEEDRRRLLAEKREKAHQAELNKFKNKEEIIDNVQLWGLWQTEDEVDSGLSLIKTKN